MSNETPIPTYRCIHCTLVRCHYPGTTCQECCANVAASFGGLTDDRTLETCRAKFSNTFRFTHEPYVPQPETMIEGPCDNPPPQAILDLEGGYLIHEAFATELRELLKTEP